MNGWTPLTPRSDDDTVESALSDLVRDYDKCWSGLDFVGLSRAARLVSLAMTIGLAQTKLDNDLPAAKKLIAETHDNVRDDAITGGRHR